MNSEHTLHTEGQEDLPRQNTMNLSQQEYHFYQTTQQCKQSAKYANDYSIGYFENSLQEEDSKDEESIHGGMTSGVANDNQVNNHQTIESGIDQNSSYNQQQFFTQYQTQNINKKYLQRDKQQNLFSNSFDESAPSLDLKPQRNCKSSSRMMHKNSKRQPVIPSIPVPQLQNLSTGSAGGNGNGGFLTAGSLSKKQGAFNTFLKQKQLQTSYQQAIINQMTRVNTQNSFEVKNDLSNRAIPQNQSIYQQIQLQQQQQKMNANNSFINMNQYFGPTPNQSNNKLIPSQNLNNSNHNSINNSNNPVISQIILSAGGQMPRGGLNTSMDPQTYLREKQQKYKSSRSIQTNNQMKKQNPHIIANSAYLMQQKKGNQTQKTNNNNDRSVCSSNGSVIGSASMTTTMTGIKSLGEVKNPQMFISWKFSDRKITDLKDIGQFKNLTDLDISGNLLQTEIQELKSLQFLKKLNLSNNHISELYPLPHTLEILNISQNCLKKLNPDVLAQLKNLTTLDISNNGLKSLDGIQNQKRLKRLLCKNNQIQDIQPLNDIQFLIEIDLENNPFDSHFIILKALQNKNDILVVNLKQTPIMLMIQNYEQFIEQISKDEATLSSLSIELIDHLKRKLKFFSNGILYRSKRVYLKIKTIQQHSKRSSSNFSNGSSSCGRVGTGSRINLNNNSNAFSPLVNNTVTTPNYQYTTQRLEDIISLFDEILDEEEEIERKQNRINKKKQNDCGGNASEDEDESLYEEDNPSLSCDEDIDDLQSFRNHNGNKDFLNESTADFNKEIRQINQELRDQFGSEFQVENQEHLQSLQSTGTNKKNPISFKLDLSKCTQQQSEEDEHNEHEEDDNFEIPALQNVKVTDDSFRQLQKQQSQQQSLRVKNQVQKQPEDVKKNTLREYPPKTIQKQIIIPKLQLGVLQQSSKNSNIPIKSIQPSTTILNNNNSSQSLLSINSIKNDEKGQDHKNIFEEMITLRKQLQQEKESNSEQIKILKNIIDEIKEIFNYTQEIQFLPQFIKQEYEKLKESQKDLRKTYENLQVKFTKMKDQQKQDNELLQKFEENEKTIKQLKEQLQKKDSENQINNDACESYSQGVKRTTSTQYDKNSNFLKNPQIFYQSDLKAKDYSARDNIDFENLNLRQKKKVSCDIKKIKRPSSVIGQRKLSSGVKINNLLKIEPSNPHSNLIQIDDPQYINEYGQSTQEYPKTSDQNIHLNQTMNKRVGHYIERLKERNSSLQERLNGSFGSGYQSIPTKISPLNLQKVNLNLTQQQEKMSNPYIMSPKLDDQNNNNNKSTVKNQSNNFMNPPIHKITSYQGNLTSNAQTGEIQIRKLTNPDSINSVIEYSNREYNSQQQQNTSQHSKTQRIHIKKIQYNQLYLSSQNKFQKNGQIDTKNNNSSVSIVINALDPNIDETNNQINLFYGKDNTVSQNQSQGMKNSNFANSKIL